MCYQELYGRISPKLKAIARRVYRVNARFTEEDLLQEGITYLWQENNARKLEGKTDSYILQRFYFFLKNYMRVNNKLLDRHSSSFTAVNVGFNHDDDEVIERLASLEYERDVVLDDIHARFLEEEITSILNARERKVLNYALQGYTVREIGGKLGISHVMVIKIVKSIRGKCRKLKNELYE